MLPQYFSSLYELNNAAKKKKKNFLLCFSDPSANISFTFVNDRNYFKREKSSNKERGGGGRKERKREKEKDSSKKIEKIEKKS